LIEEWTEEVKVAVKKPVPVATKPEDTKEGEPLKPVETPKSE